MVYLTAIEDTTTFRAFINMPCIASTYVATVQLCFARNLSVRRNEIDASPRSLTILSLLAKRWHGWRRVIAPEYLPRGLHGYNKYRIAT